MGRSLLLFVFIIAAYFKLGASQPASQQAGPAKTATTTIFLLRHAEKDTSKPGEEDPDLTPAGRQRAQALQQYLAHTPVDAFFSTHYKRNRQTLAYLAQGRPLQIYEGHDYQKLRSRVLGEYKGKTVVIVGHSNTLLPIIEAFGGKKPLNQVSENQHDLLFKLRISSRGKTSVKTLRYGALSS
ncbi:MAG: histidine phosphatase family protein [Adhaeribacter sp.]